MAEGKYKTDRKYCTCCGKTLNPERIVQLELDQRIDQYHDFGDIPDQFNQGSFEFGPACAKKERNAARAKLEELAMAGC